MAAVGAEAAAAEAAGGWEGQGDAGVEEIARQLEDLNFGPKRKLALQKPRIQTINTEGRRFVYFDLETTGLSPYCHITQIAACSGHQGDNVLSHYVLPKKPIQEEAQRITGISCTGQEMFHHGEQVLCLRIKQALTGFIRFLEEEEEPVVLVGHNIGRFDCLVLLNALRHCRLEGRFQNAVHGFVDTLPLFKDINKEVENYKQVTLYKHYIGEEFSAHDAKEDVKALQKIVGEASPGHEILSRHSFTFEYVLEFQRYSKTKAEYKRPWMDLVNQKVIRNNIADKAAEKSLEWSEVCTTFQKDGEEAARNMLKERLTQTNKILDGICEHLRGKIPDSQ